MLECELVFIVTSELFLVWHLCIVVGHKLTQPGRVQLLAVLLCETFFKKLTPIYAVKEKNIIRQNGCEIIINIWKKTNIIK